MKRRKLVQLFVRKGWYLEREGGNHEIWTNGADFERIPRHKEVDEMLARALIKKWELK